MLLLDLMMPEVSGYDVLREMTLSGLRPDLPVLVLTNFPEPRNEDERRLLEQGLVLDVIAEDRRAREPAAAAAGAGPAPARSRRRSPRRRRREPVREAA